MATWLTSIIVAAIPALASIITTLITSVSTKRDAEKNAIRNQILTMILNDKVERTAESKIIIHQLFDHYKNDLKGNSWLAGKVADYDEWIKKLEENI